MANTYERLVEAGAPAIVEPLFYRIREIDGVPLGGLQVEVRLRRPRGGSDLVAARYVAPQRTAQAKLQAVVNMCQEAFEAYDADQILDRLVGDHSRPAVPFN